MRAYKVVAQDGETAVATRYGSTQADARQVRDDLADLFGLKKGQVSIEEIEVPMTKPDLLEFINELAALNDLVEDDEDTGDGEEAK